MRINAMISNSNVYNHFSSWTLRMSVIIFIFLSDWLCRLKAFPKCQLATKCTKLQSRFGWIFPECLLWFHNGDRLCSQADLSQKTSLYYVSQRQLSFTCIRYNQYRVEIENIHDDFTIVSDRQNVSKVNSSLCKEPCRERSCAKCLHKSALYMARLGEHVLSTKWFHLSASPCRERSCAKCLHKSALYMATLGEHFLSTKWFHLSASPCREPSRLAI